MQEINLIGNQCRDDKTGIKLSNFLDLVRTLNSCIWSNYKLFIEDAEQPASYCSKVKLLALLALTCENKPFISNVYK